MAFDPNYNSSGACKNQMTSEVSAGLNWYPNEESLDLSSYMTNSANLELCNDDLFQNLFPSTLDSGSADIKKANLDHFNDEEVESWYQNVTSEPTSACNSAAPSPIPANYYNTPPVTPQSERQRNPSPHHLQFDKLTTPMSSSSFASLRADDGNYMPMHHQMQLNPQNQHAMVKQEPELEHASVFSHQIPTISRVITKTEQQNPHIGPLNKDIRNELGQTASPIRQLIKRRLPVEPNSPSKKSKTLVKGSQEYREKRERNNDAVRRSRDKAKMKAQETQKKVEELSSENSQLHERVAKLTNELNTLRGLLQGKYHMNA